MENCREPYPSDDSDEEWSLNVPYLTLQREDAEAAPQSRSVFIRVIRVANHRGGLK